MEECLFYLNLAVDGTSRCISCWRMVINCDVNKTKDRGHLARLRCSSLRFPPTEATKLEVPRQRSSASTASTLLLYLVLLTLEV